MPYLVILSNIEHRVFLLRSKVNKKRNPWSDLSEHGLWLFLWSWQKFGLNAPFVQIKWGTGEANVTFPLFILYCFCVHLHFQKWKCYFYCTFWYLFESNVLYGCILHVYWIYQRAGARAFEAHELKQLCFFSYFLFSVGVYRSLVLFLPCWVFDTSCMASDVGWGKIRDLNLSKGSL